MIHESKVIKYPGTLKELADDIGYLRYDKTAEFIQQLANNLRKQAKGDEKRDRLTLAKEGYDTADYLDKAYESMMKAWKICEPNMK